MSVSSTQPETNEKVWIDNENNVIKTKNDDGTFKTIYDESKMNKTNYSTEEQVIGTWFGKPLYRKCISITSEFNTSMQIAHGVPNLYEITDYHGNIWWENYPSRIFPSINPFDNNFSASLYSYNNNNLDLVIGNLILEKITKINIVI